MIKEYLPDKLREGRMCTCDVTCIVMFKWGKVSSGLMERAMKNKHIVGYQVPRITGSMGRHSRTSRCDQICSNVQEGCAQPPHISKALLDSSKTHFRFAIKLEVHVRGFQQAL